MSATPELPQTRQIALALDERGVLGVTLDRADAKNAMNLEMVREIEALFVAIQDRRDVRVVVLRGAGGNFCAGGDVKDMAVARGTTPKEGEPDPLVAVNRAFGRMITRVDRAPQATIAVLEGAVLGGGFGLACVCDVAIAHVGAKLGLPETGLGLPPAQIAPFVVRRVGLSQARRLAVTGGRFDGREAARIGLVHAVGDDEAAVEAELARTIELVLRSAPGAVAATKHLVLQVGAVDLERLLDEGAERFAACARGPEGSEGTMAFIQKRLPAWAPKPGGDA